MVEVSTSLLSVEKEGAIQKFYNLEVAHTDYFHIDVMDGKFVEKDTTETMLEYAQTIKQISNVPLDVHLMVEDVQKYVEEYIPLEPNIITFHYEAVKEAVANRDNKENAGDSLVEENKETKKTIEAEILKIIDLIKQNNIKVGISIKPATPVEEIYNLLPYIHMVLIMTVEPGKGGQKLIPETVDKIKQLKKYITENNIEIDIEADGGINEQTIESVKQAGTDIIVAGSAIINAQDYAEAIKKLSC